MKSQAIPPKKRIEFVDLAKGICIMLVVLLHCNIYLPGFDYIRMPLYFILSGMFFKRYSGFLNFSVRKTNKILIPFIFYFLTSYIIYLLISHFFPQIELNSVQEKFSLSDPFFSRLMFNNPIWFLLALFNASIIFYIIQESCTNKWLQLFIVVILGFVGNLLFKEGITLPVYLNKTLGYLPFFYFGFILKKTDILYPNKYDKYNFALVLLLLSIFVLCVYFDLASYSTILGYFMSLIGVMTVLLICKIIKRIPLVSFYGRYSIVILCTHHLIYRPVKYLLMQFLPVTIYSNLLLFIITLIIEIPTIYFCKDCLGYVTAQKDIIPVTIGESKNKD